MNVMVLKTNIFYPLRTQANKAVRNISFSENFVYVLSR